MGKTAKKRKRINWENVLTIKNTAITLIISLPLCVGSYFLIDTGSYAAALFYLIVMLIALIGTMLSSTFLFIAIIKFIAGSAAEAQRKVEAQEEERLAKIKATMTPAEWETYKLQMENNRLLKNIQNRGNSTQTTRVFGITE